MINLPGTGRHNQGKHAPQKTTSGRQRTLASSADSADCLRCLKKWMFLAHSGFLLAHYNGAGTPTVMENGAKLNSFRNLLDDDPFVKFPQRRHHRHVPINVWISIFGWRTQANLRMFETRHDVAVGSPPNGQSQNWWSTNGSKQPLMDFVGTLMQ